VEALVEVLQLAVLAVLVVAEWVPTEVLVFLRQVTQVAVVAVRITT